MRKVLLSIPIGVLLISVSLLGCSDSGSEVPPPGAKQGPVPPELPSGAEDGMKASLKAKLKAPVKSGQSGQVPH